MATAHDDAAERFPPPDLPSARETMYGELKPLIERLIRTYSAVQDDEGDLHSEIYVCFCALYDAYDPAHGIPLLPYMVANLPRTVHAHRRTCWPQQRREGSTRVMAKELLEQRLLLLAPSAAERQEPCVPLEELAARLPGALARVPLQQRQVVIGRFYDGRSLKEMAAWLKVSPDMTQSLLRHGLANLRAQLAPGYPSSPGQPHGPAPDETADP